MMLHLNQQRSTTASSHWVPLPPQVEYRSIHARGGITSLGKGSGQTPSTLTLKASWGRYKLGWALFVLNKENNRITVISLAQLGSNRYEGQDVTKGNLPHSFMPTFSQKKRCLEKLQVPCWSAMQTSIRPWNANFLLAQSRASLYKVNQRISSSHLPGRKRVENRIRGKESGATRTPDTGSEGKAWMDVIYSSVSQLLNDEYNSLIKMQIWVHQIWKGT